VADTGVTPGVSGYGDKTVEPSSSSYERASGYLDPPGHLSTDPALSQRGGYTGPLTQGDGGDGTPEFGKEPSQVQSASDGDAKKHHDEGRH
jgi:hypothetical protein